MMQGKELAVRRWAMKVGKTTAERAVLYGLAYELNGRGDLGEIRVAAKSWLPSAKVETEAGLEPKPVAIAVRPALRSLQQAGQVQFLPNSQWRAV